MCTLSSLKTGPSTDNGPRYLHRSPFRERPNLDYEHRLSRALHDIEHREQSSHKSEETPGTIWQIFLGQEPTRELRGEDSLTFEERNSDWEYKVRNDFGDLEMVISRDVSTGPHDSLACMLTLTPSYQLITSAWADEFITSTLSSIPGLADLYYSYPHHVLRADLLRYLILWYYGGYYADMDVFPKRTIRKCPSLRNSVFNINPPDVSLVIGIEIDEPFASPQKMREWHWVRRYGFIQYNIYAPHRFSPILREIIVRVLSHTQSHIDKSSIFRGPRYDEKSTLEITGPGVFTDTVLDVLSDTLPATHRLVLASVNADRGLGDLIPPGSREPVPRVTWAPFHQLLNPLCVDASEAKPGSHLGGLCVLPVSAWGNGQRHSGSEGFGSQRACINHRFGGTWKPWKQSWKKYLLG
ncbi:hypothetical protein N7468_007703 [Penicillium chermesinum]|uniref:Uncharacterized protein n=1 Tax=Penicillium chermesinum TaxID=63820 RepID=A0A9W9NWY3_9EURO|nr:uncharacterized protein N7468_007703 [Penicillium chermesinum]KAJ5226478.1 hypothetical protein N7468_007703 [Penicillium chermesinum]